MQFISEKVNLILLNYPIYFLHTSMINSCIFFLKLNCKVIFFIILMKEETTKLVITFITSLSFHEENSGSIKSL